jgi:uncharacterized protein
MQGVSRECFDERINSHAEILILNVTDQCNLRCGYCTFSGAYYGQRRHGPNTMALETALEAVDQLVARAGKTLENPEKKLGINFYGGEPLLAFDRIRQILEQVHRVRYPGLAHRLMHSITTNGTLLDDEKVDVLSRYDVAVKVSIDGPAELHDRNRCCHDGSGSFTTIMSRLERIRDRCPEFFRRMGFVVTMCPPFRYLQRAEFFDGHPLFRGHPLLVTAVATTNCSLEFDVSEQEREHIEFRELLRRMHRKAVAGDLGGAVFESGLFSQGLARLRHAQGETGREVIGPNGCCIPGQRRLLVSTGGRYFLCDKVAQNDRFSLGDVASGVSTDRAWRIYNDYMNLSRPDCCMCPFGSICDYCPSSAMEGDYLGLVQKRRQCASKLPYTKQLLELYASIVEDVPPSELDAWIAPQLF